MPNVDDADAQRPPAEPARRLRILLAEDNRMIAMVAGCILGRAGHSVDRVGNGREALEAVSALRYDLVLMDIEMPEMDGFEATRRIRALAGEAGRVPVIALTAHRAEADRDRYRDAGMNGHASKPIDPDRLAAAILEHTGVYRALEPFLPPDAVAADASGADAPAMRDLLKTIDEIVGQ